MSDPAPSPPHLSLAARLEAMLFAAPGAATPAQLAAALEISVDRVEAGLAEIEAASVERGIRLQRHGGKIQLVTHPEAASEIERLLGLEASSRLSRAALECLAIIAYQQPVTRPEIDAIRGVNSEGVLKNLLSKGLVQEVGRADRPGRPILYSTTADFLLNFGLASLSDLPELDEANS